MTYQPLNTCTYMYLWSQFLLSCGIGMEAFKPHKLRLSQKNTWTALPSNTPNNFPVNPLASHLWQSHGRCMRQGQQYSAVRDFVGTSNLPALLMDYVCLKETDHITDWGKPTINPRNWDSCVSAPPQVTKWFVNKVHHSELSQSFCGSLIRVYCKVQLAFEYIQ